jgi:hypothetical protein
MPEIDSKPPPRLGTIAAACQLVGGDRPITSMTYYRGVRRKIYPAPFRVSPGCSRVDLDKLAEMIRERADAAGADAV